jgi:adenylosuccinate synthase
MPLDIVVGTQWGDEGKGRVVDLLAAQADFVARYSGGDNAGHTVTVGERTFRLHLVPSGLVYPHTIGVIGNGVVINPKILLSEMDAIRKAGIEINPERLFISYAAHMITPGHIALDAAQEIALSNQKIGTTLRGIGPAYTEKIARRGIRMGQIFNIDSFHTALQEHLTTVNHTLTVLYNQEPLDSEKIIDEFINQSLELQPYIKDVSLVLSSALKAGKRILAEGAQGTLLDIDHGTYPFVTSSNPTAPGAFIGLGLGVGHVERVIGVTKAFQTRVGEGPFPTELSGEIALSLRGTGEKPWDEYGTTTGRPRRVGWLDLVLLRYAIRVNGVTQLTVTKLDVLSGIKEIKLCNSYQVNGKILSELPFGPTNLTSCQPIYETLAGWDQDIQDCHRWEKLPGSARAYIRRLEELVGVTIKLISVGPERNQMIEMR